MYFVDSLKLLFNLSFNDMASKVALVSKYNLTSYLDSHQLYDYFGCMSDFDQLKQLNPISEGVHQPFYITGGVQKAWK